MKRHLLLITITLTLALAGLAIAKAHTTTIRLGKTSFGMSLVAQRLQNGRGIPIYIFTHDSRTKSRCSGSCTAMFTPVIDLGTLKALSGARQKLLGVIKRGHGITQVTYNHHPLYTGAYDTPGVASEDGCQLYGGSWFVVDRNGKPDTRFTIACGY